MSVFYELNERRVVPNWRDFKRTLQLGELTTSFKKTNSITFNINRPLDDWKNNKNIGVAADLINSAFISDIIDHPEINEAVKFIKTHSSKSSDILLEIIERLNKVNVSYDNKENSILEIDADTLEEFQSIVNNNVFKKIVSKTKKKARTQLYNPIMWVELSRLYTISGLYIQAENAMNIALHLAPNNRFVLRSATRLFIHNENFDKAIFHLKNSDSMKSDPWLISAHIATSSIMERYSPYIKTGKALIDSNNFSHFELTELNSSIGSLELSDGSFKKAKRFFDASLINPNDNSLAQFEWASRIDSRLNNLSLNRYNKVKNPFEAFALDNYENEKWVESLENSIKWFLDMPFSKRPILFASHITNTVLNDKNASIILCEAGLKSNPNDPNLLNSIVYAIATSDDLTLLGKYFNQMKNVNINSLNDTTKTVYQATFGLVAFKKNDFKTGMKLYSLAIENAKKLNNEYLKNMAIVNLTMQLIEYNLPEKEEYIKKVKRIKVKKNQPDLNKFVNDIIQKL